ncbi:prepilin peptidase [Candidatus Dependentiae bacterium]|nr:prepilin peptidase [Candidatus Dependentiae bacterium]
MIEFYSSPLITALIGLCLGSFLHALAHRIAFEKPLFRKRSHCPNCDVMIAWYQNIPILSWVLLGGKCYHCKMRISWIYPFTELMSATAFTLVWHYLPIQSSYMGIAYSVFIAALIVATTTDLHTFTIPQAASIWIAPIGIIAAAFNLLHISLLQSIIGAFIGYSSLWIVNFAFKKIRGIDGIGIGDMELLCMIGAFIGPAGLWHTILIASTVGCFWGLFINMIYKDACRIIPFGPFLALGASCHLFFARYIWAFLMPGL